VNRDHHLVVGIQEVFRDEQGEEITLGEAAPVDESWWQFVTPDSLDNAYQMIVTVEDLAGNVAEKSWGLHPFVG
jgi:hypothetical protein